MAFDVLLLKESNIRGIDTNSLLRMYDLAQGVVTHADSKMERAKANRAAERVAPRNREEERLTAMACEKHDPLVRTSGQFAVRAANSLGNRSYRPSSRQRGLTFIVTSAAP